jgi:hypothetical protein
MPALLAERSCRWSSTHPAAKDAESWSADPSFRVEDRIPPASVRNPRSDAQLRRRARWNDRDKWNAAHCQGRTARREDPEAVASAGEHYDMCGIPATCAQQGRDEKKRQITKN